MNNYQLESTLVQDSYSKSVETYISKYKYYLIAILLGTLTAITVNIILGVSLSLISCVATYIYKIWMDISTINLTPESLNLELRDVINDLEYR